jgi:acetylornithine deacetylase/succinyl-diaminopimelate desuccinylase-like protein
MTLAERIVAARESEASAGDALAALASELIRVPSPTGEEHRLAEFLARLLGDLGWADVAVDERANLVARVAGAGAGPRLMFLIHSDAPDPGRMSEPYDGAIEDGAPLGKSGPVVRGLGSSTPKGVIAAMLVAADRLRQERASLHGELLLAVVTRDLLANNDGIRDIHEAGVTADYVVAGEPTSNRIVTAARGIAHYDLRLTGNAAHAGTPDQAINPVPLASRVVLGIHDLELGVHDRLGPATVNELSIEARGTTPQTPEECRLWLDYRPLPGDSPVGMLELLRELGEGIVADTGASVTVDLVQSMYPFGVEESGEFVALGQEVLAEVTGARREPDVIPFATNGGYAVEKMGARAFCFGPGEIADAGERAHVAVSELVEAERFYSTMARRVLQRDP